MFEKFLNSQIKPETYNAANHILQQGFDCDINIVHYYGDECYEAVAEFKDRRYYVTARLCVNYNEVFHFSCQCNHHYYLNHYCEHYICLLMAVEQYYKDHPISYTSRQLTSLMARHPVVNELKQSVLAPIHLYPTLSIENERLAVSYKIGNDKSYIVKSIQELVTRMRKHEEFSYGKKFAYNHDPKRLDETSFKNYQIIKHYVEINESINHEYEYSYYYNHVEPKKYLFLTGKLLDDFFEINYGKNVGINLSKDFDPGNIEIMQEGQFFQIKMPNMMMIEGEKYSYIYDGLTLYQVDASYNEIGDICNTFYRNDGSLLIDEGDMRQLYATLVPALSKQFPIITNYDESLYTPIKPTFTFFLDSEDGDVTLVYTLKYRDKDYRINIVEDQDIRNLAIETAVDELIHRYFTSDDQFTYHIQDDDKLFELISYGIDELNQYGEVFASNKFKRMSLFKTPQINIGVNLGSNLLNFNIDIEGVDVNEINAILNSYRQKKKYHRLTTGEFLMIDESKFEAIDELAGKSKKDLKALAEGNLQIPMYRSLYLDKLLEENDSIVYDPSIAFKQLINDFDHIKSQKVELPDHLADILRNYQKDGYEWLLKLHHYHFGGILADDMGLGKTLQMISLLEKLKGSIEPSLVVCPASLVYNWESELKRFAPDLTVLLMVGTQKERQMNLERYHDYDVIVTSYDLLKRDITYYEDKQFGIEVIDEAQFIKNANTLQAKAVKGIKAETKFALSGTPIENRLSELWSIFDYLMPGFLYSYTQFKNEFENPIVKNKDEKMMKKLQKMVGPFILRRNKKDVLQDLPDKIERVMYAKMEKKQEDLYTSYTKRIKVSLSGQSEQSFKENKIEILKELMRLRQLCCDPTLFLENYKGGSCKLQQCLDLVETGVDGGHKILLFSQFTSMFDIIAHELQQRGIAYYMITGQTNKEDRIKYVNQFNNDDVPVFLISLKAGGTGLNLTAADIVIHYDPWWNEAAMNQATDRAHRIGQKNVVTVYKMIVKDTIEEEILKLQEAKSQLASDILEGSATSMSSLTREDLLAILK